MHDAKEQSWKEQFRSYLTRVTFNLTLTRPMMELLCGLSIDVYWDRRAFGAMLEPDCWLVTSHALIKRGLIMKKPTLVLERERRWFAGHNKGWYPPWRLTPAGEAVVQMLKVGGIFLEPETARQQLAARKGRV